MNCWTLAHCKPVHCMDMAMLVAQNPQRVGSRHTAGSSCALPWCCHPQRNSTENLLVLQSEPFSKKMLGKQDRQMRAVCPWAEVPHSNVASMVSNYGMACMTNEDRTNTAVLKSLEPSGQL
mmetsp:Transcript_3003/g.7009  ORF Transcript_3003/g.7009 Transcript_3003/m.7009 type:complete len:121 (+) Transcript_3003:490-852(+)